MSPQSMQLIYRRSGHHYNDRRHRIMPPPQQQRHYLISNHIIKQGGNYKNSTLRCYSALPMPMTNVSTVHAINLSPQQTSLQRLAPSNNAASTAAASLFD